VRSYVEVQWVCKRVMCPQNVGYCPQDNALSDMLTGREMLTLMGRLRGLSHKTLSMHIDSIARCLLLDKHIDRLTYTYRSASHIYGP
jgi:ABC-type multidrug transport system ATPase subunit